MRRVPTRPSLDLNSHKIAPLDINSLDTVERVIEYCRVNGFIRNNEVDIERIIENIPNLTLEKKKLPSEIDAYIREVSPGKWEIGVNSAHSETRQRFSLAHEFAHFQLHRHNLHQFAEGEKILHRSDERNELEYQANNFAAGVLMPEGEFKSLVRQLDGDIDKIAARFNVSPISVRYRAKALNMRGHGV